MIDVYAVATLCTLIGFGIGALVMYHIYKHDHSWEKIIDHIETNIGGRATGHVVVYMCKKCGKTKITRV